MAIPTITTDQDAQIPTMNAALQALTAQFVLTWDYLSSVALSGVITGGHVPGTSVDLADQTVALTANQTRYVECDAATYVISSNTSGYTTGGTKKKVGIVTTNASGMTGWKQDFYPGISATP